MAFVRWESANSASNTAARGPTIRRPAARWSASTRPSKNTCGRYPPPRPSPSCNTRSTHSWPTTTAFARTGRYDAAPHRGVHRPPQGIPDRLPHPPALPGAARENRRRRVITIRYNSRLHHIGSSKRRRGTTVIVLIDDLDNRVLDRDTGTLIRKLVLDPTRDYQPRRVKCGNAPENRLPV
jgi:hypothetical protein